MSGDNWRERALAAEQALEEMRNSSRDFASTSEPLTVPDTSVNADGWLPIASAPRSPVAPGWRCGPDIYLRPSWAHLGGPNAWTVGRWLISDSDEHGGWFEFLGEDGPQDEQPTHWQPLPPPPPESSAQGSERSDDEGGLRDEPTQNPKPEGAS